MREREREREGRKRFHRRRLSTPHRAQLFFRKKLDLDLDLKTTLKKQPNGGVELIVGNHLLEGTFIELKKPFAVLKKEGGRSGNGGGGGGAEGRLERHSGGGGGGDNSSGSSNSTDNTRYKVVGVVRRKCLFKARPRALIARLI